MAEQHKPPAAALELGLRLRGARKARNMTQEDVAIAAGEVDRAQVSKLESGAWAIRLDVSIERAALVAEAVGLEWSELKEGYDLAKRQRQAERGATRSWVRFGVAPPIEGKRPYASLDIVWGQETNDEVEGRMKRVAPPPRPPDPATRWKFTGLITPGSEATFYTFTPTGGAEGTNKFHAHGVMAVEQIGPKTWQGTYVKWDSKSRSGETHLLLNDYRWRSVDLADEHVVAAFGDVALLDFDNTLAPGWMMARWLDYLLDHGLAKFADARRAFDEHLADFRPNVATPTGSTTGISHNELASLTAGEFANACMRLPESDIRSLAQAFAHREAAGVYAFTKPLIRAIKEHRIEPILVSGAPAIVLEALAPLLGVARTHAMTLGVAESDGRSVFTGTVLSNPGRDTDKLDVVRSIDNEQKRVVLAVGDSSSDEPMWRSAAVNVKVGRKPVDKSLSFDVKVPDPENWTGERLTEALAKHIPSPETRGWPPTLEPCEELYRWLMEEDPP